LVTRLTFSSNGVKRV